MNSGQDGQYDLAEDLEYFPSPFGGAWNKESQCAHSNDDHDCHWGDGVNKRLPEEQSSPG